MAIFWVFQ